MTYRPTEAEQAEHQRSAQEIVRLLAIMARLRRPDGCPWDREQTLESLRPYLLEETYEVLEAIDEGDDVGHREELGDLLLQIVFQAELAREEGRWSMAEVAAGIAGKLHVRHPHVFGDTEAADSADALKSWEQVKAVEKKHRKSIIDGVPKAAPALLRAERITDKASHVGFDWPELKDVRAKVDEELAELDEAVAGGRQERIEAELGDVLFALANLARFVGVHPEDALRGTIQRFIGRFQHIEARLAAEGKRPADLDLAALDRLWDEAKARE